jgi:hypothetical protein
MKKTYQIQHNEHVTRRPFEEVIQAFERAVGSVEGIYDALVAMSHDNDENQTTRAFDNFASHNPDVPSENFVTLYFHRFTTVKSNPCLTSNRTGC